jgi:hypothetical protein
MIILEMFTKNFYKIGFELSPGREADEEHISLHVREMCALRHVSKNRYQYPLLTLFILIFLDISNQQH